ncbi:MAG: helix-turn-helix domain-containing protein [Clostridia bacterium]|nr:helix-turn-helix domain-containing protein [Clostridia bacterium]
MKFAKVALKDTLNISGIYSVHYFEFSKTYTFPGESHDFWEMVYVDKGRIIATAGERDMVLQSGEVIFHKPDEWHNIRADGAVAPNVMVVSFDCRSPAMAALISRKQKISSSQREVLGELLSEAQLAFSSPLGDPYDSTLVRRKNSATGCEQLVKVHLLRFLLSLLRESASPAATDRKRGSLPLLDAIIEYMEQNLHQKLTLTTLAQEFHVSQSHIKRLFAQYRSRGAMQIFADMKVSRAKQLLRESDRNVTEIAESLGYDSIYYFCNQFKKHTGMSPLEYRRSVIATGDIAKNLY